MLAGKAGGLVQVPDDFKGVSGVNGSELRRLLVRGMIGVERGRGGCAGGAYQVDDSWCSESALLLSRGMKFEEEEMGMSSGQSWALSVRMQWSDDFKVVEGVK